MAEGDTLVNALVGAAVTILLSFLPLSPLLGGVLAGYLEGGDAREGVRVGAAAGAIALVPLALFGVLVIGFGVFYLAGGLPYHLSVVGVLALVLVGLFLVGLYTVGLSALGGWLGNYLRTDADLGPA